MRSLLLILPCILAMPAANGQPGTDSLLSALYKTQDNDSLFEHLVMANRRSIYSHPEETYALYETIRRLAMERGLPKVAAAALDVQGIYFQNTGVFDSAELKYRAGLALRRALGQPILVAQSYNNLGVLNRRRGQYDSALYYYQQAFAVAEGQGDSLHMGDYLSNIGLVYQNQQDFDNAVQYNLRSLAIRQALGDTLKMAASYNNIGII